jgi:hypothetical protein
MSRLPITGVCGRRDEPHLLATKWSHWFENGLELLELISLYGC